MEYIGAQKKKKKEPKRLEVGVTPLAIGIPFSLCHQSSIMWGTGSLWLTTQRKRRSGGSGDAFFYFVVFFFFFPLFFFCFFHHFPFKKETTTTRAKVWTRAAHQVTVDASYCSSCAYPTFRVVQSATVAVLKREKNPAKPQGEPASLPYPVSVSFLLSFLLTYMWYAAVSCRSAQLCVSATATQPRNRCARPSHDLNNPKAEKVRPRRSKRNNAFPQER